MAWHLPSTFFIDLRKASDQDNITFVLFLYNVSSYRTFVSIYMSLTREAEICLHTNFASFDLERLVQVAQ